MKNPLSRRDYKKLLKSLPLVLLLVILGLSYVLKSTAPGVYSQIEGFLIEQQPGYYEVVYVNDGDTITVKGTNSKEDKVRFIGIDTPEKDHPSKPVQCFAREATKHLEGLIGNSDVKLVADPTNTNRDRYDRLLRYVYLPDGTLLNAKMIEDGYAFAYTSFPVIKMDEFMALEKQAMEEGRGLWSLCNVELDDGYLNTNPI